METTSHLQQDFKNGKSKRINAFIILIDMKYIFISVLVFPVMFASVKSLLKHHDLEPAVINIIPEDTAYHIDANFAAKGFGYDPTISSVKKKYASKLAEVKKAIINPYDSKIEDTIVSLSGQGMKFVFYKQIKNTTLTEASIASPVIVLQKGIKTGLTKNQVMKKFPEMAMAMVAVDLWQIGNEERTQYFELDFKNNVLKTIRYFNPVD